MNLETSVHNTFLLREASEIFETNSTRPINFKIDDKLRPVVTVMPDIDIVRTAQASATLFTTPTDRDFFLTNVWLSNNGDEGVSYITFVTFDGITQKIQLANGVLELGNSATSVVFPMRGVRLQKNSPIVFNATVSGSGMIAGYRGSDRS